MDLPYSIFVFYDSCRNDPNRGEGGGDAEEGDDGIGISDEGREADEGGQKARKGGQRGGKGAVAREGGQARDQQKGATRHGRHDGKQEREGGKSP